MINLELLAYDFFNELKELDEFKSLKDLNREINVSLEKEINNYIKIKEEYEEVLKYGNYHPDFKEVSNKYRLEKISLFTNPLMVKQKELYDFLENIINKFIYNISSNISENIPVLNEIGFISKKGGISCGS